MKTILFLSLLISAPLWGGGCFSRSNVVVPLQEEEKQELARVVQQHTNAVRRRAMTVPIARQVQHNRRNRHRVYLGDIPQEPGLTDQLRRRFSDQAKEKATAQVDIKPTGLHVSFSLD